MSRKKANPENKVRGTTELLPQSRSTRIAGEAAAQCPRAPATQDGTSAATTDIRKRGAKPNTSLSSAYFRHYVVCPPSSFVVAAYEEAARVGRAPPLIYGAPRHKRAREGALAKLARGPLAKQAAVVADASGSSEAGAAEEALLSSPEDVRLDPEEVRRLPKTSERMRAEDSEETVWYVLDWHTGHLRRVKMESSAVADKESSAVAGGVPRSGGQVVGKGRARGLQVEGCMLLVEGGG